MSHFQRCLEGIAVGTYLLVTTNSQGQPVAVVSTYTSLDEVVKERRMYPAVCRRDIVQLTAQGARFVSYTL